MIPPAGKREAVSRHHWENADAASFPFAERGEFPVNSGKLGGRARRGTAAMKSTVSKSVREAALAQLKTAMIEKKLTQSELADAADCHEKTIQNLLGGRSVRDQTLFDVCVVLGLDFEKVRAAWNGGASGQPSDLHGEGGVVAPVYMGAYTRAAVDHYLGSFLTLRPSFSQPGSIVAYRTDITWDAEWPSLLFQERDRPDAPYSHRGRLYIPSSSSFIHLVSLTKGAMRMVVVSQVDRFGEMRGIITTLHKHGAMLVPVATPIVYAKRESFEGPFGTIGTDSPAYKGYRATLDDTVAQGYARLVGL
jgi:transcriptional regulator with XRE-family HTH domain